MAWTERLPSGKYRGVYRDAFGKRRSAGTFTHKAKALRAAGAKEDDVRKSLVQDADAHKQTWGQWEPTWWASRTVGAGTLKRDASRRDQYLSPKWGEVPLGQITRHDVKTWVAELKRGAWSRKPLENSTVQRIVHLFSASMVAAIDAEIIRANPAARLKLPASPSSKDRYLERAEFDAIHKSMPTVDDQLVFSVLTYCGLRFGELSALRWRRLDLSHGLLVVAASFDDHTGLHSPFPKGKRSRVVPVQPWLVKLLQAKRDKDKPRPGDLVFTSERGKVLRRSNWDNVFRDAVAKTNMGTEDEPVAIEDVTIHTTRHTYCSWLAQAGVDLAEIARLAGHISTATTQRYAHLRPTDSSRVFDALGTPTFAPVQDDESEGSAPRLPHAEQGDDHATKRRRRSEVVGPVGLEPTTRGLKE